MNAKTKKIDDGTTHEQTFNEALGVVLRKLRGGWKDKVVTERNNSFVGGGRADNLIYPNSMQPVVVEAAFAGTPDIDKDAISRLGRVENKSKREIMTAVSLKIPEVLRDVEVLEDVQKWIEEGGELEYAVYSLSKESNGEIPSKNFDVRYPDGEPNKGYIRGTVKDLANLIELASTPDKKIKQMADAAGDTVVGCGDKMHEAIPEATRRVIAGKIGQPSEMHTMRVAACVWLNALVLHDKLAAALPQSEIVAPFNCEDWQEIADAWRTILKIDYKSVFRPALGALKALSAHGAIADEILGELKVVALRINALHLGHAADVGSDMFPKLATDRKETAAFYTLPKVAELLAGLAFNLIPDDGRDLKIADFACGTGALLKAAYRHARCRAEPITADDSRIHHRRYMEKNLYGADIQPIAAHLTTAGLAGMNPGAPYEKSNIVCANIRDGKTGSLELLDSASLDDLFGESSVARADADESDDKEFYSAAHKSFDLCIMNPPYTRAAGGRKLFDVEGMQESERNASVSNLSKMMRKSFSGKSAGMAAAFCVLGDRKLKMGGVLAVVLPSTAAGQSSWRGFRAHMLDNYSEVTVIGLVPGAKESFSSDTAMGEMMILGRKGEKGQNSELTVINLYQLPRDFVEAHEIARAVRDVKTCGKLKVGEHAFGVCIKSRHTGGESWGAVGAKSDKLGRVAENLTRGKLLSLGLAHDFDFSVPMSNLSEHGCVGVTHHSIGHFPGAKETCGAFELREIQEGDLPLNLSLWNANCKTQTRLLCDPTHIGETITGKEENARDMLAQYSKLFISRNLTMPSQKLAGTITNTDSMGGRAWTALHVDDSMRAAYCLWLNSTLGLIVRWQHAGKQQPGRAVMQINGIKSFPCPAFSGKTAAAKSAVRIASKNFARLSEMELMPCSMAWRDDTRKKIDRVVLKMLGLDKKGNKVTEQQMQDLRNEWCREPSVHAGNKMIKERLSADGLISPRNISR